MNLGSGHVAVEIDDDEPPSAYDIPAQISITRVNKQNLMPAKQFLKVRNDLSGSRFPPPQHGGGNPQPQRMYPSQHHPSAMRTTQPGGVMPPLIRAGPGMPGLPPMPRLRLGGARAPMSRRMQGPVPNPNVNPMASMFNMVHPNNMMRPPPLPPPRPFVPHHPPQQNIPPPAPAPSHNSLRDVRRPTPNSVTNGGNMRHNLPAGASVLRPQHRPPVPKHRPIVRPMHSPHHNMIPQDPLPIRCPPPRVITSSPKGS